MSDLINREEVLKKLDYEMKYGAVIDQCGLDTAYDIIENIPSTEPKERTAKVKSKNYYGTTTNIVSYFTCIGKCGNCDCEVNEHYAYCPVCGCRLEWK